MYEQHYVRPRNVPGGGKVQCLRGDFVALKTSQARTKRIQPDLSRSVDGLCPGP